MVSCHLSPHSLVSVPVKEESYVSYVGLVRKARWHMFSVGVLQLVSPMRDQKFDNDRSKLQMVIGEAESLI